MRSGFTTGSAATAASAAAAYMLLSGKIKEEITILTPAGIDYRADILEIEREDNSVTCAVRKDGGDDPDITNGSLIFSTVEIINEDSDKAEVEIDGGIGVGRVTKKGLDRAPGEAAINSVPRKMIETEVLKIAEEFDFRGKFKVTISVPDGEELARKTFNPRLGIVGGISILGTSGIVKPMSLEAIKETIRTELSVKKAEGRKIAVMTPGNYGKAFLREKFNYNIDDAVQTANFIGDSLDMAVDAGFETFLIIGALGKLVKLAGGIMNTHSREADCRMEILSAAALRSGASADEAREILSSVTTEDAMTIIEKYGYRDKLMKDIMFRAEDALKRRSGGRIRTEIMIYSNSFGLLGESSAAEEYLEKSMEFTNE
ncbi:cobalt-precorrin-5B (C(1))-methyltransferase CbiD [Lachnospiraceae bacterium C1.1]|nr:cobalt-precorrin-5B (C(1))-methyltransferase CbiD [Lachnospiraceae bacterium C1.1]